MKPFGILTTQGPFAKLGTRSRRRAGMESLEDRIAVVAEALVMHRPALLEERFVPPAVRERIEAVRPPT